MTDRPSKRGAMTLTVVPLLAAAFVGCDDNDNQAYCVDEDNEIVQNDQCGDEGGGGSSGFFWIYGGHTSGGQKYVKGARISGGDRIASTNKSAIKAKGGGFGSSSKGGVGRATSSGGKSGGFGGGGFSGGG